MRINFRSRHSRQFQGGNSLSKRKNPSWEWEWIGAYSGGDARHIIWKKSTQNQISEKKFEDSSNFSFIFANIFSESDDFSAWDFPSKKIFKKNSIKILEENAVREKIPFRIFEEKNLEIFEKKILQEKISKHLIFIFCSDFPFDKGKILEKIARLNEIIFIFPYHPFEKNPDNSILLEQKIFNKKFLEKYLADLSENEKKIAKMLSEYRSHFIATETDKNIAVTLNYFFKNDYK